MGFKIKVDMCDVAPNRPPGWRAQVYRGMISAARGIVAQHGPLGLYNGLGITLLEIVPYAALQFGLYDTFNTAYDVARVRVQGFGAVSCYVLGSRALGQLFNMDCTPLRVRVVKLR